MAPDARSSDGGAGCGGVHDYWYRLVYMNYLTRNVPTDKMNEMFAITVRTILEFEFLDSKGMELRLVDLLRTLRSELGVLNRLIGGAALARAQRIRQVSACKAVIRPLLYRYMTKLSLTTLVAAFSACAHRDVQAMADATPLNREELLSVLLHTDKGRGQRL